MSTKRKRLNIKSQIRGKLMMRKKRAEKFRWKNIAKEMMNVYDELVKCQ